MFKYAAVFAVLATPALSTGLEIDLEGEANGTIVIDLFEDTAPLHVAQITAIAEAGMSAQAATRHEGSNQCGERGSTESFAQ